MPNFYKIAALSDSPWQDYLRCSETQLFRYFEPNPGLFLAESPNVIARALHAGFQPISFLIDRKELTESLYALLETCGNVTVYLAEQETMHQISGMHLTRGVLCAMRRKSAFPVLPLSADIQRIALLENVMNPTNLGAIFRSAAALGMDGVLLTRGCTDPLYRRSARVSMGTVFQIPWGYCADKVDGAWAVRQLREMGFLTAAMALRNDTLSVNDARLRHSEKLAVVLGTEGEGLAAETIAACDYTVKIPMTHGVDSLNVAAASAVAFWAVNSDFLK